MEAEAELEMERKLERKEGLLGKCEDDGSLAQLCCAGPQDRLLINDVLEQMRSGRKNRKAALR